MKNFDEVFEDRTKYGTKIKTSEYQKRGKYAIIDQGQEQISGYTDIEEGLFEDVPVIIFGDHTRVVKYVDEPFFLGADGVKVLKSKYIDANYRYLYYALKNVPIPNTGYNRHFKWLKEVKIKYPSQEKQKNIVRVLDNLSNIINKRQKELLQFDNLIKARFVEMFGDPLENKKSWKILNAVEICTITDGSHFSPEGIEKGYPMLSVKNMRNDGFHYENCKFISQENYDVLVKQGCKPLKNDVLIAKDGSYFYYGFVVKKEREQAILSSIAILRPDLTQVLPEYLCKYMLSTEIVKLVGRNYVTGAAIKRVILKGIKQIPVMLPPLELQQEFSDFVNQVDKSKVAVQINKDTTQELLITYIFIINKCCYK